MRPSHLTLRIRMGLLIINHWWSMLVDNPCNSLHRKNRVPAHIYNMVCLGIKPGLRWWVVGRLTSWDTSRKSIYFWRKHPLAILPLKLSEIFKVGASQHGCFLDKLWSYYTRLPFIHAANKTCQAQKLETLVNYATIRALLTVSTSEMEITW
jgi:hypothetical protein